MIGAYKVRRLRNTTGCGPSPCRSMELANIITVGIDETLLLGSEMRSLTPTRFFVHGWNLVAWPVMLVVAFRCEPVGIAPQKAGSHAPRSFAQSAASIRPVALPYRPTVTLLNAGNQINLFDEKGTISINVVVVCRWPSGYRLGLYQCSVPIFCSALVAAAVRNFQCVDKPTMVELRT